MRKLMISNNKVNDGNLFDVSKIIVGTSGFYINGDNVVLIGSASGWSSGHSYLPLNLLSGVTYTFTASWSPISTFSHFAIYNSANTRVAYLNGASPLLKTYTPTVDDVYKICIGGTKDIIIPINTIKIYK